MIGRREPIIRFLSEDELNAIHWAIVEDFKKDRDPIAPPGIRDVTLFGSALFRPQTSLAGFPKYPTVSMAGGALFHAIVHNHPFHNGNKRTAVVALIAFLDFNGWVLMAEEDELFAYVLQLAQHRVAVPYDRDSPHTADAEVLAAARWIQRNGRKVHKGESRMPFHRVRGILASYGCDFKVLEGARILITRGELSSHVYYADEGRQVDIGNIHKIRRDLELDEAHGIDSEIFYNSKARIPAFIAKYRKILERLGEYDRKGDAALD